MWNILKNDAKLVQAKLWEFLQLLTQEFAWLYLISEF